MHILNSQVLIHSLYHKSLCIYMNNYELIIPNSYKIVNTLFVKVCKQIYILYINTPFYMQIPSIKYKLYTIFIYLIGDKDKLFLRRQKKAHDKIVVRNGWPGFCPHTRLLDISLLANGPHYSASRSPGRSYI